MIPVWLIGVIVVIIGAVLLIGLTDPFEIIILAAIGAFMLSTIMEK